MYSGTRTRSKKSKRVIPVSTAPSPDIALDNLPDIQQVIGAAIVSIVEQQRTDQPTPNHSRNCAEQQESEANMTNQQHIESLTGEQQAPVHYHYISMYP